MACFRPHRLFASAGLCRVIPSSRNTCYLGLGIHSERFCTSLPQIGGRERAPDGRRSRPPGHLTAAQRQQHMSRAGSPPMQTISHAADGSASRQAGGEETYAFGPWKICASEVFLTTSLSFAFVNLRPLVPGHVLVSPKRVVGRFYDLSVDEVADLWTAAHRVGQRLEPHYGANSMTYAIQDGPAAGQTVPHVHIHILPRQVPNHVHRTASTGKPVKNHAVCWENS